MDDASTHLHYRELIVDDTLRLITPDVSHAHSSLEWVREQDVVQYMGVDFPTPTIEGEQVRMNDIIDNTDAYSWMIELQGAVIGNVCINDIKETSEKQGKRAGNLTILIGSKEHWGKGIGARACAAVCSGLFSKRVLK